jgi:ribosomal protein S18 acetylase RimI-like enzyme
VTAPCVGALRLTLLIYGWRLSGLDFTVRPCSTEDLPQVLKLWLEARSEHATTADRPEDLQRLLSQPQARLLVAVADGIVLGVLIAAWDGWRGNMYRLAVAATRRRRGIATALVRAGEEHLRGHGASRIIALVAYEDETASAFWEVAGYPCDPVIGRRVRNL